MKKSILVALLIHCINILMAQDIPENLSNEDKIYGLSKVWKEVDKNFVFFDQVSDLDWDKTYQDYIPKVLETSTTYEYYKKLQEFCSLLKDGHTRVTVPRKLSEVYEISPPITTELFDNKVIITKIQNDTIKKLGLSEGMEIISIDGVSVHQYASENVEPYVFYSTEQDMKVQVYEHHLLKGHIDKPLILKTKENKTFSINRKLSKPAEETPLFDFKVLDGNIGYLKISIFWGNDFQAQFDSIYPSLKKTSKLIIDVSENQGGNNDFAYYVVSHFIDQPFNTSRWKTLMYIPAFASWGWNTQWLDNNGSEVKPVEASSQYKNPIVVLISEKTYSAGEDFVSAFLNSKRGTIIGRPTAGSTGNPIGFALPGNGFLAVCSKRDYLSDGTEFVGYGIKPMIKIPKIYEKDYLIKEGIKILNKID